MLIGELARQTGLRAGTIRFYERRHLIAAAPRAASGYRLYADRTVHEIAFIKQAQRIGFSLVEIQEFLEIGRGGRLPCHRVVTACQTHLTDIDQQMAELRRFRRRLARTLHLAQGRCGFSVEGFCRAIMPVHIERPGPGPELRAGVGKERRARSVGRSGR